MSILERLLIGVKKKVIDKNKKEFMEKKHDR